MRHRTAQRRMGSLVGLLCYSRITVAYEISSDAFDAKQYFNEPKDTKRNDRYTHFAVAASKLALEDAGISSNKLMNPSQAQGGGFRYFAGPSGDGNVQL